MLWAWEITPFVNKREKVDAGQHAHQLTNASMKALPWILVLILLAATGFLFTGTKKNAAELEKLRQNNVELQQLRAELAEAKKAEAQNAEATLAEKEKQELIRLRNEVGQLKRDKQQLSTQVQQAQQNSERILQTQQAQAQQTQQLQQQNQQLAQQTEVEKAKNACINNLKQIDGAKQQWALENKQTAEAVPSSQQLAPYFKNVPVCPLGGVYTLGNMESFPTCSIAGHVLSQ